MPDIPGPGSQLVELGKGIMQAGLGMADVATGQTPAKSTLDKDLIDAAEVDQLTRAQKRVDARVNLFLDGLDSVEDPDTYLDEWVKVKTEAEADVVDILQLQGAKNKFATWTTTLYDATTEKVLQKARDKYTARAETGAFSYAKELEDAGEPEKLAELARSLSGKTISADDANGIIEKAVPVANYNKWAKALRKMDYTEALDIVSQPDFGDVSGLGSDQVEKLTKDLTSLHDTQTKVAELRLDAEGKKRWDEYSASRGMWTLEQMDSYKKLVDRSHVSLVEADIAAENKRLENLDAESQSKFATSVLADIWQWASAPTENPAPWDEAKIQEASGIRLATGVPALTEQAAKDIRKALVDAAALKDNRQASDMYSRLYQALDSKKNPALEVTIKEIDDIIQTPEEHDALLEKRRVLQNEYESGLDKMNVTKESVEIEAYKVVYSPTMSTAAKKAWIDSRQGNGLSSDDATKWRAKVDPYNDDDNRKRAMGALLDAYQTSMKNPNLSTARVKELELELYKAQQQMEGVFLANPEAPAVWDEQIKRILQDKAVNDINSLIRQTVGTDITKFATGEARGPYKTATLIEMLHEQGAAPVGAMTEDNIKMARQLENDAFKNAKLPDYQKFTATLSSGELVYSNKQIQKKDGKIIPSADLYVVRYDPEAAKQGIAKPQILRMNPTTLRFTELVWEPK